MKKNLISLAGLAGLVLGVGSCAYDPFATDGGYNRSSVNVAYGHGYGYGGGSFVTSHFWTTGDSRWGYDPYVRSYYDYQRRCYYDPFLHGYYPVGYRPPILVGVPHPVGYRHGWCPPPRRITNVTIVNYRNREAAYRNTNYGWARNVRYGHGSRVGNDGFRGRNIDRNADRTDPRFISGRSNDARRAPEPRRIAAGRFVDGEHGSRRGSAARPRVGPESEPVRPDAGRMGRDGARIPWGNRSIDRPGGERREWNGRGIARPERPQARSEPAVPAGRMWAGRQPGPVPAMIPAGSGRGADQGGRGNPAPPPAAGSRWQRPPSGNDGAGPRFGGNLGGRVRNDSRQ